MKILHILGEIDGGGVGAVVLNYMRHIDKSDMEIHILAFEKQDKTEQLLEAEFRNCGCQLMYIRHRNLGYVRHFRSIYQLIKKEKYDVVHCHFNIWSAPYLFIAMILGVKVRIAHSHTAGTVYSPAKELALNLLYPMLCISATDRFACGQDAGIHLWGNGHAFYIMRNAIDTENFRFQDEIRDQYRHILNIPSDVTVVGHIGRFSQEKNQAFILELAQQLYEMNTDIRFVLVGDGENFERIKTEIDNRHLKQSVFLLGVRKDISQLLQAFDIFILPSQYEGLPVAAVEAQASGLPVILSTEITREVALLDSTTYLPIDSGVDQWIQELTKIVGEMNYRQRSICASLVRDQGYDIECEAAKLRQYYLDALVNR